MLESLDDPLSTSQLLSGFGDILARLEADATQAKLFKPSRPTNRTYVRGRRELGRDQLLAESLTGLPFHVASAGTAKAAA